MFCTTCGKQLNGYESFCTFCGGKVNPSRPVEVLSEAVETVPPTPCAVAPSQPIAAQPAPENQLRRQIKRISRNRIILHAILSVNLFPMFLLFFVSALFSILSPEYYNSISYGPSELIAGLIIFGVPGIMFPVKFIQAIISYLNYTKCPAYKKLGNFAGLSPEEFNNMQYRDMNSPLLFSHKRLTLTAHWVFIHSSFSLRIFPSSKLVWIYMKEHTTYEKNTWREISSKNYAVFEFSDGSRRSVGASYKICHEMLIGAAQSYPHLLVGYTDENKNLYNNITTSISVSTLLKRGQGMDNI